MKKVLITGSSGLVGKETIKKLLADTDYYIYAATSKDIVSDNDHLVYIKNPEIESVLKNNTIDVILQLAFPRNVSEDKWSDGMSFVGHIINLAYKYNIDKFINVSSQSLYGWKRDAYAKEGDAVYLNSPYTTGKFFSEIMVNELLSGANSTNVRLSTVIGPTTSERVVNKFFTQIMEGKDLTIKGGQQIFSFLDVRDAASGLAEIVKTDKKLKPLYNLGTKESMSLIEIANETRNIAMEAGYNPNILVEEADIVLNNILNVSLMEEDFGWKAEYSMYEAMKYIFECMHR